MNSILWILGGVAAIALIVVVSIQSFKKRFFDKTAETPHQLLFSDTPVGRNLNDLVRSITNDSPDISARMEQVRSDPREYVHEISNSFDKLPEPAYDAKWLLTYCASQLELPECIELLAKIARSKIPPERSKHIHQFSTVAEETAIRLRAIDGLVNMAKKNNKEAESKLFQVLTSEYISLSIAACQGLLEVDTQSRKKILETLPPDKKHIIDIVRKPVKEIILTKKDQQETSVSSSVVRKPLAGSQPMQIVSEKLSRAKPPKTR